MSVEECQTTRRSWNIAWVLLAIVLGLSITLCASTAISSFWNNLGYVYLVETINEAREDAHTGEGGEPPSQAPEAVAMLQKAVHWKADNARAWWALVYARFLAGERDGAADALLRAQALQHDNLAIPQDDYRYHILQGVLHRRAGNWDEAVREYQVGLALGVNRVGHDVYIEFYKALVGLYRSRLNDDPTNAKWRNLLGKYLAKSGDSLAAEAEFRWIANHARHSDLQSSDWGEVYYRIGLVLEMQGRSAEALDSYRMALDYYPRIVDAYWRLEQIYRARGWTDRAEEINERLATLEPEYRLSGNNTVCGISMAMPETKALSEESLKGSHQDCWTLLGYDLDEEALETGAEIAIALYWLSHESLEIAAPGWYQAGDHWIELREITNLAPNGGFEWDEGEGAMHPFGYPGVIYSGEIFDHHRVMIDKRDSKETKVVVLDNTEEPHRSSLSSFGRPIDWQGVYLQAAWVKSSDGAGGMGRIWKGGVKVWQSYSYVDCKKKPGAWTYCSGIAKPLQEGKMLYLWLLNVGSSRKVLYDDHLFFRLDIP